MTDQPEEPVADHGRAGHADHASDRLGDRRPSRWWFVGSVAFAGVAAVCAVVFGLLWLISSHTEDAEYSAARDDVLRVGEQAAINFTSLDYRKLDDYQTRSSQSSTGALHDSLAGSVAQYRQSVTGAKLVVRSSLITASVSALDTHAGTASVLVLLKTDTTRDGVQPSEQRLPIFLDMTKVGSAWKASAIGGDTASTVPGH